jgi:hypothetical protein
MSDDHEQQPAMVMQYNSSDHDDQMLDSKLGFLALPSCLKDHSPHLHLLGSWLKVC